jgi:hypothetical protein
VSHNAKFKEHLDSAICKRPNVLELDLKFPQKLKGQQALLISKLAGHKGSKAL